MTDSQVLARKWRPKDFSELVGQEHVVRALVNSMTQNRLHHAYLFTGTRGIGKTTVARILAKALNCAQGVTPSPCGQCAACLAIDQGNYIDLIELDAASNTQVDAMRELLDNAQYAPVAARYKVYLIDEVHMLSKSAFNAMLKTLEEPPEHVKFILATTDPQKIPVTVLSRCLQFNLKQIPPALIAKRLAEILEQENITADNTALKLLAQAAKGSLRDALSLLDQAIAFGNAIVDEVQVRSMLGTLDQDYLLALLEALADQNGPAMFAIADELEATGISFDQALQDLATQLHRIAAAQTVPDTLDDTLPEYERLLALTHRFTAEDVQLFYQVALHGRADMHLAPDEYCGFTMTLMRMLAFYPDQDQTIQKSTIQKKITTDYRTVREETPVSIKPTAQETPRPKSEPIVTQPPPAKPEPQADIAAPSPSTSNLSPNEAWHNLVKQLKLSGMTKMLALHCEAHSCSVEKIELYLAEQHKHLLEKSYQDKLKTQLKAHFGQPVPISFSLQEESVGPTPMEQQNRRKAEKQARAVEAIQTDPYVQELIEQFDAKLNIDSIKPID